MTAVAPKQTVAAPHPGPAKWTTPRLLLAAQFAIWAGALLFLVTALYGVSQHRAAVQTIGKDSAPSIIAAQHIKSALADMDANAVNELIAQPFKNADAIKGFEDRRQEVSDNLVTAAQNITYGDAERKPILAIQNTLGNYLLFLGRARTIHERRERGASMAYRDANALLHTTLFPNADALDKANADVLDQTYASTRTLSAFTLFLTVVVGLALTAGLIALQLLLSRRMKRTINPPLLAATLLLLAFIGLLTSTFQADTHDVKVIKEDAFDSIRALWHARALAFDANAEESRWLLDKTQATAYEQGFFAKADQIAHIPAGSTFEAVAGQAASGQLPPGFKGDIAAELNNITFPGEREKAIAMLRAFGAYVAIDAQIRKLSNAGQYDAAVALCTGNQPGQSNWAYDQFDSALMATIKVNQDAFDDAVQAGFGKLAILPLLTPVVAVCIAVLTFFGLRPRLHEYAV